MARLKMVEIGGVSGLVSEDEALCASPIACAAADAWILVNIEISAGSLCTALDALEAATRESPLRRVRP